MGKVVGINGRVPPNEPPRIWVMNTCEDCGWPHFRWLVDENEITRWSLVCAACDTSYSITVTKDSLVTDDE